MKENGRNRKCGLKEAKYELEMCELRRKWNQMEEMKRINIVKNKWRN